MPDGSPPQPTRGMTGARAPIHRAPAPGRTPTPGLRGLVALVCGITLAVGLVALTAGLLWRARVNEIESWRIRASHATTVIATHARQSVKAAEMALTAIIEHLPTEPGPSPSPQNGAPQNDALQSDAALRARLAGADVTAMMRQYVGGVPQLGNVGLLDARGILINTTATMPADQLSLADRDYFAAAMRPGFKGLFISAPVRSRVDGGWTFYIACKIAAPDASGAGTIGVLVASVRIDFFEEYYRDISLGEYSTTLLLRGDGTLLVRDPPMRDALGTSFRAQPVMRALEQRVPGETTPVTVITDAPRMLAQDGALTRIVASTRLDDINLVAAVVIGEDLYLARWTRGASLAMTSLSVVAVGILVLTWAVRRLLGRAERQAADLRAAFAELRESQANLREKTRLLDLTLDHVDQGIAMITADKRMPLINRRALELLELPAHFAAGGATFDDVQAYQNARNEFANVDDAVRPALASNAVFALEDHYTRTRPNGTVLEIRTRPLPDGGLIRSYTDITKTNETEAKLRRVQRMEAVGQLTAGIAHDFNNILGIIVGNLELATDQVMSDPDGAIEFAGEARQAAMLAAGLVRRLLAFSRMQDMQIQPTDLADMLEATQPLLRQAVAGHLDIVTDLPADLWQVGIDTPQLQNALINLAANARVAAPAGSTLRIAAANYSVADPALEADADLRPGEYVRITVADAGAGMSEEIRARVFEPFFTTRPIGSGSGLGLSMVLGTLQQMGGTVRIDSAEGQGTAVHLFVPRA